jgi:succinate-acetate transporter protein
MNMIERLHNMGYNKRFWVIFTLLILFSALTAVGFVLISPLVILVPFILFVCYGVAKIINAGWELEHGNKRLR